MHGEERHFLPNGFANETHTVLIGDAKAAGECCIERRFILSKKRDGRLVHTEAEPAAFGLVPAPKSWALFVATISPVARFWATWS